MGIVFTISNDSNCSFLQLYSFRYFCLTFFISNKYTDIDGDWFDHVNFEVLLA